MTVTNPPRPDFPPLPGWLRRAGWLVVLVCGVAAYVVVLRVMVATENINFFPALLLIGATTVPLSVLALVYAGRRRLVVPPWVVLSTAIVGGIVGVLAAGVLEYDTMRGLGVLPMVFVAIIEEAAKLVVPLLLLVLFRPRDARPGVVVGVASGMGFAVLETMGYGFQALLSAHSIAAVDETLLLRGLLSPSCHIAWTGMTVAMLWRLPSAQHRGRALTALGATYLVAVALHATWDGSSSLPVHVLVASISLLVLIGFILRSHRRAESMMGQR